MNALASFQISWSLCKKWSLNKKTKNINYIHQLLKKSKFNYYSFELEFNQIIYLEISPFFFLNFSLRCQSLTYLKLYKMRRHEIKECQKTISDYLSKSGFTEAPNGNTPSPLSPTNSVGSQVKKIWNPYSKNNKFTFILFYFPYFRHLKRRKLSFIRKIIMEK